MAILVNPHVRAQRTHDRAAEFHDRAAAFWNAHGDYDRDAAERALARAQRAGAEIEGKRRRRWDAAHRA